MNEQGDYVGAISPEIIDKLQQVSLEKDGKIKYLAVILMDFIKYLKADVSYDVLATDFSLNNLEFEVRFGSKRRTEMTKTQFDTVVKYLKSFGYKQITNTFENKMRIIVGSDRDSNLRVELDGLVPIQQYCRTENIESIIQLNKDTIRFTNKAIYADDTGIYEPYYNEDYDMKYSFTREEELEVNDKIVRGVRQNWRTTDKLYRVINRLSFTDGTEDTPLFNIDMSVVKQSGNRRNSKSMLNSGVIDAYPVYEIECELSNENLFKQLFVLCASMTPSSTLGEIQKRLTDFKDDISSQLKKVVKLVMMGVQDSKHIMTVKEDSITRNNYSLLVFDRDFSTLRPNHFCGPSSYTLQPENILPLDNEATEEGEVEEGEIQLNTKGSEIPNIRGHYCVTDKADGMRKLLYVNGDGRMYFINTNMVFQYTGCHIKTNKALFNSILDGEHVVHDKNGKFINLFLAFDIYFVNGKNIRGLPFTVMGAGGSTNDEQRLKYLNDYMRDVSNEWNKHNKRKMPLMMRSKKFFISQQDFSIFECCFKIIDGVRGGDFEYETDGLIFTPTLLPVGSSKMDQQASMTKTTWANSFKWKPPKYNTVDFLVTTHKTSNSVDKIDNIYDNGRGGEIKQYKTITLRCGYDKNKHGIIDACGMVLNGERLRRSQSIDDNDDYLPAPFFPTNPYDDMAHLCHIRLKSDTMGNTVMITLEGEVFEDEMIVEFSYDTTAPQLERWKPLRVRYDKTQEYRSGYKNFGNAYHVANSNWQSIHNPISDYAITTGEQLPKPLNEDVYYSTKHKSDLTRSLRTFHNIVVKQTLLEVGSMVSVPTLLDLAVGKAGDLNKWIYTRFEKVVGLDISKDNINNPNDGACVRYLLKQDRNTRDETVPASLFFQANSSLNIKKGDAFYSDKERGYMGILYGANPIKEDTPRRVKQFSGQFKEGFGVSACMFALHYFFKNSETLKSFLTNVAENTIKDGLFIGCCFDGNKVFELLSGKKKNGSHSIQHNGELITRITKKYDQTIFDANSMSLGMAIDVYQESIGSETTEYLVNFDYLTKVMSLFGFEVLGNDVIKEMFPNGPKTAIGGFSQFKNMMEDANINLESYEKELSYLNKYFIFRKKINVDIGAIGAIDDVGMIDMLMEQREDQMTRILIDQMKQEDDILKQKPSPPDEESSETPLRPEKVIESTPIVKPRKKIKLKIKRGVNKDN